MTLSEKQRHFAKMLGQLLTWIYQQPGLEVTMGDAWRSPEMAAVYAAQGKGIKRSLHIDRLAVDLNLYLHGVYQGDSEPYRIIGEYWESLDPKNRWGGRFTRQDGNHFEYNG